MRFRLLSTLCPLFTPGCGDAAARSSLAASSCTHAGSDVEEECYLSQFCGPPVPDAPHSCAEEQGDRRCHRCRQKDDDRGPGERCGTGELVTWTDVQTMATLCCK
ncbi:hypothetical protein [Myxococcus stipitatus]|uniref:hypothetical protein n=1 Tax=Myxococcus stipitatus TaxID=83455 RepID=UPI0030CC7C55